MSHKDIYGIYEHVNFIYSYTQVLYGFKSYKQFAVEALKNSLIKQIIFR